MAYIHTLTNQYPVSESDIRYANLNTSFSTPFVPPDEYAWVFPAPQPSYDYTTEQVREIAPIVVNDHYEQRWEITSLPEEAITQNIQTKKQRMIEQVNSKRDELEESGFIYMGKLIDSDSRSVQRISTAVQAAQIAITINTPFQLDWMCADNTILILTAEQLLGMPVALATHANAIHIYGRSVKDIINNATTSTELDAIDINSGWPSTGV